MASSAKVSLPSIHEMFPEHLVRGPSHLVSSSSNPPVSVSSTTRISSSPKGSSAHLRERHASSSSGAQDSCPTARCPSPHAYRPRDSHMSSHLSPRPVTKRIRPSPSDNGAAAPASDFSFVVLRSDPSGFSLEPVTSMAPFPAPGHAAGSHSPLAPSNKSAISFQETRPNRSMPIFRVSPARHHPQGQEISERHHSPSSFSSSTLTDDGDAIIPDSSDARTTSLRFRSGSGSRVSSEPDSGRGYSSVISFPVASRSTRRFPTASEYGAFPEQTGASDGTRRSGNTVGRAISIVTHGAMGSENSLSAAASGKKHICSICSKRFNRPSSLRIHVNTHTGATPFRCPWPNCGREFNVNSNMRRHYRNHSAPGYARSVVARSRLDNDGRRRHSRIALPHQASSVFLNHASTTCIGQAFHWPQSLSPIMHNGIPTSPSPPISSLSVTDDEDEEAPRSSGSAATWVDDDEIEVDELESDDDKFVDGGNQKVRTTQRHRMHVDALLIPPPRSSYAHSLPAPLSPYSLPSSPSSSSPSSPSSYTDSPPIAHTVHSGSAKSDPIYSPSMPYIRSFADSKVSTALRPAFHDESQHSYDSRHSC